MSKSRIQAVVVGAALVWVVAVWFSGLPITGGYVKAFLSVPGALATAWSVYDRWLWRVNAIARWTGAPPDLRGTWEGFVRPAGGAHRVEARLFLCIDQSASKLTVWCYTEESESRSTSAGFSARNSVSSQLDYTYDNAPRQSVRHRSAPHVGAARLAASGRQPSRMSGTYWTDRGSHGELEVTKVSARASGSYADAVELSVSTAPDPQLASVA